MNFILPHEIITLVYDYSDHFVSINILLSNYNLLKYIAHYSHYKDIIFYLSIVYIKLLSKFNVQFNVQSNDINSINKSDKSNDTNISKINILLDLHNLHKLCSYIYIGDCKNSKISKHTPITYLDSKDIKTFVLDNKYINYILNALSRLTEKKLNKGNFYMPIISTQHCDQYFPSENENLLFLACYLGLNKLITMLINLGIDITVNNNYSLKLAIKNGKLHTVKKINKNIQINQIDQIDQINQIDQIDQIDQINKINKVNQMDILILAIESNSFDMFKYIYESAFFIDYPKLIVKATTNENIDMIKYILYNPIINVNILNNNINLLHELICITTEKGNINILYFYSRLVNCNLCDIYKFTYILGDILNISIANNHINITSSILEYIFSFYYHGALPSIKYLFENSDTDNTKEKYDENMNKFNFSNAETLLFNNWDEYIRILNSMINSALRIALAKQNLEIIKLLTINGVVISKKRMSTLFKNQSIFNPNNYLFEDTKNYLVNFNNYNRRHK
jgi:hypothetical protein